MITALEIIVVILALLIIGVVVAQKSKTQGMGAGFGGGAEDLFGSRARGMDALLSKLTIILSVAFTIFTLVLGRLLNTYLAGYRRSGVMTDVSHAGFPLL